MGNGEWLQVDEDPTEEGVVSYCPECRELNRLSETAGIGDPVVCRHCGKHYVVTGTTTPSLVEKQRLKALLKALLVVAVLGAYVLWPRVTAFVVQSWPYRLGRE